MFSSSTVIEQISSNQKTKKIYILWKSKNNNRFTLILIHAIHLSISVLWNNSLCRIYYIFFSYGKIHVWMSSSERFNNIYNYQICIIIYIRDINFYKYQLKREQYQPGSYQTMGIVCRDHVRM